LPGSGSGEIIAVLDFPEARTTDYDELIARMKNDPKDRHVLAVAVRSGAQLIVTSNLRDFPASSLSEWGVEVRHPHHFLIGLFELDRETVVSKLRDRAETIGRDLPGLLRTLQVGVPRFVETVVASLAPDVSSPGPVSRAESGAAIVVRRCANMHLQPPRRRK